MECSLWNSSLHMFLNPYFTPTSIHVPRLFPVGIKQSNTVCLFNLGPFHSPLSLHYQTEKRWNDCRCRISVAVFIWMRSIYSTQNSTIRHAATQWTQQLHTFHSSAGGRLRKYTAAVYKRSTLYDNPKTGVFMPAVSVPLTILIYLTTISVTFLNVWSLNKLNCI